MTGDIGDPAQRTGTRLTVALDARVVSGESGGVESVIIGLVSGLSHLADGDETYLVLAYEGEDAWIRPYASGAVQILNVRRGRGRLHRLGIAAPWLARAWRKRPRRSVAPIGPPQSDGTIERMGADVMHFTFQAGFRTAIPSIYHPHDLQHLHLPGFFTEEERVWRETWYRFMCNQATMVAVASKWTKRDVETQYGLDQSKVRVVPFAPPTSAYGTMDPGAQALIRSRLGVPPTYVLYPAQTWPHKNHIGLLRALSLLRKQGLDVSLVAPGQRNDHFAELRSEQERLGIGDLVTWSGFVTPTDLLALYAGARAVVIPTRFEAASAPMWEAFNAGVPVASSNVTSLPEQAGDAALMFDPDDIPGIALAIRRLWTDPDLRRELVARGRRRLESLSWERTARIFRAHYRRISGTPLTADDRILVESDAPF